MSADLKPTRKDRRRAQRGNIFFTLFGAVAVVGVLGATVMTTMKGPLSTMVEVNRRTQAEAQMSIGSKLVLLQAVQDLAGGGDCDGDGYVEPLEWKDAAGAGPDGVAGSAGGGFLPDAVGSEKQDPWGTSYGYCVWDAGPVVNNAACDDATVGFNRLQGSGVDDGAPYTMIAIISAGPNQAFETTCEDFADGGLTKLGDDMVSSFDYPTATAASGGLWTLKSADPTTAEIGKNLDVTGGARFSEDVDLTASTAALKLGASSMFLPTTADVTPPTCNLANNGILRVNMATAPITLEICDNANGGWLSVAAGAPIGPWSVIDPTHINYGATGGGRFVGINNATPSEALDVEGSVELSEHVKMSNAKSIQWTSGADITESSGALQIDANGGGVEITAANTGINLARDTVITGSTTGVTTVDGLVVEDSGGSDILTVQNDGNVGIGVANPTSRLSVGGNVDTSTEYQIDGTTVVKADSAVDDTILIGQGAGAGVTGANNTVIGADTGATLTTGEGNILIGADADTRAADTDDYLNVGNVIQGDIANGRVGIGFAAAYDFTTWNDALEVSGSIDASSDVHADGDVTAGDDIVATGDVSGVDITASGEIFVGAAQLGPPEECTSSQKLEWDDTAGWSCVNDLQGGSGGAGQNLEEVLVVGNDANGETMLDVGGIAVGSATLSAGDQTLVLDVTGAVGADFFCDASGDDCFTAATAASGGTAKLNTIVAADGANSISNGDHAQTWNWATTTAGKNAFTFGESTASTATGESSILKAATLAASTATPLMVTNLGAANSFRVNDETGDNDATPFIIDPAGNVGIGTTTTGAYKFATLSTTGVTAFFGSTGAVGSYVDIDNLAGGQQTAINFMDAAALKWQIGKQTDNTFFIYDLTNTRNTLQTVASGDLILQPIAGDVGVGDSTPDDGSGSGGQNLKLDIAGATGADYYCDASGLNCFQASSVAGTGIWQNNSGVIRTVDTAAPWATVDFLFGSSQMADVAAQTWDDNRMFFDKSKAAFRAGSATGTQWDDAYVGANSAAIGTNVIASGIGATALGVGATASGDYSMAMGTNAVTSGAAATALGFEALTGSGTTGDNKGNFSLAIGMGDSSAGAWTAFPKIEGVGSLGIFMGDQANVNVSANNIMALLGGRLVIDPDTTSAANTNVSTGVQQLEIDVQGDIGAVNYCDEAGNNCFTPSQVYNGNARLSALLAANADNGILNGAWNQAWAWQLTAPEVGMIFGENAASTGGNGAGDQIILAASTLSGSTAVPFAIANEGAGHSFMVADSVPDTTPFVIDAAGKVGIGLPAPLYPLHVHKTAAQNEVVARIGDDVNGFIQITPDNNATGVLLKSGDGAGEAPLWLQSSQGVGTAFRNDASNGIVFYHNNGNTASRIVWGTGDYEMAARAGNAARAAERKVYIARETGSGTTGNNLKLEAGGAITGGTDLAGGDLNLSSGIATGDGMSSIVFQTVKPGQGAGATDRAPATAMTLASNALTLPSGPTTEQPGQAGMQASALGMIRYDTTANKYQAYQNGSWQDIITSGAGGVSTALNGITAATAANTITANNDYAQAWRWTLTSAAKSAMEFSEQAAATNGVGAQSVVKMSTLAASTAMPLWIENAGAALSFRVDDIASDTTPFVIDATGKVGVGTATPAGILDVQGGTAAAAANATNINIVAQTGGTGTTDGGNIFILAGGKGTVAGTEGEVYIGSDPTSLGLTATVQIKSRQANTWALTVTPATPSGYSQVWTNNGGAFVAAVDYMGYAIFPRVNGDYAASGNLTIDSTTHATKGNIFVAPTGGNIGIGMATTPSYLLSLGGNAARTIGMENHTTADTAGNNLTLLAGGATSGATNKNGGSLILSGGASTGTGDSDVEIHGYQNGSDVVLGKFFGNTRGLAVGAASSTIGNNSIAFGNSTASGNYSMAGGWNNTASGDNSFAMGGNAAFASAGSTFAFGDGAIAAAANSMASGYQAITSGAYSFSRGRDVRVGDGTAGADGAGNGNYSVAFGMADSAAATANIPKVTGDGSFVIFMGDQDSVDVTTSNIMALLGGRLVIDPDTTSAANTNVSTGVQQLELDVQGDIGAVNYCDEAGNNCFTAATAASGGTSALHAITAATNTNTIASGDHAQIWNWATTTAGKDAFTFGETTASTASGESSILKAETLAASTATPLMVTNLGAANSFRVNDETGDNDATPFVVDAAGNVGIGTAAPDTKLMVAGTIRVGDGGETCAGGNFTGGLRYNGGNIEWCNGTAWQSLAGTGSISNALSALTNAAAANNITGNADYAQAWRWTLTSAAKSAMEFGEQAAATNGVGAQSVVRMSTLATSTAMPLWIKNEGAANSLLVEDVASDTSPFVIDAAGQVGVGTTSPGQTLHVAGTGLIVPAAGWSGTNTAYLYLGDTNNWISSQFGGSTSLVAYNGLSFVTDQGGAAAEKMRILAGGNVGIGTSAPSYLLSFGGNAARTVGMERHTTADTAGNNLTLLAGGATIGATNKAGGDLILSGGIATGTGDSNVVINGYQNGASVPLMTLYGNTQSAALGSNTASGNLSMAIGTNNVASGHYSFVAGAWSSAGYASGAIGSTVNAGGNNSFGWGNNVIAGGHNSMAGGNGAYGSGDDSITLGREVRVGSGTPHDGAGDLSIALGLGDASSATNATYPKVEGVGSFGIFMGDQDSVNISANNIMALLGGRLVIDPDTTSAANVNVSTGAQQLELDVQGDIGAVNYCDEAGNNCFTATSILTGVTPRINSLIAANASNTTANGDHAQIWNWATTTAGKDAFTFGETTASTATGESSILKAATLAASTATPLMVTNLGDANAFRVNDETGDNDATPFVIDPAGQVGIGTMTPDAALRITSTGAQFKIDDSFGRYLTLLSGHSTIYTAGGSSAAQTVKHVFTASGSLNPTTGDAGSVQATGIFAPTSGTANFNTIVATSTINQTGGANGISRGLYINPTITAAADWRAIEINGNTAQTIGMDRHATADTAGNSLTVYAGGATTGATNKNGGNLILSGGIATGTGDSSVTINGYQNGSSVNLLSLYGDRQSSAFGSAAAAGTESMAAGYLSSASGNYSTALGYVSGATGVWSTSIGFATRASGSQSMALGTGVWAGSGTAGDLTGTGSIAIGLTTNPANYAKITGNHSLGIFMGDQDSVDITANNIMALLGGRIVIDPDTTSAANTNVSTGAQQLELDVQGDIGAVNYCDEAGNNCFTAATASSGGTAKLNSILAADNTATIASGDNAILWNWATTTAGKDAFTFGETTASTATGESSILKAATLATSTATPFMVTNLGAANSFRVNDETGDNDTSPFVIDAAGKVGIGVTSPGVALSIDSGNANQIALFNSTGNPGMPYISVTGQFNTGGINFGTTTVSGTRVEGNGSDLTLFGASAINFHNGTNVLVRADGGGNVGIGTGVATPSYLLSLDGDTSARTIGMERETTAATAGRALTLLAGGAKSGGTDLAGGDAIISAGTATGNGGSDILFYGARSNQGAGTTDRAPAEVGRLTGGGIFKIGVPVNTGDTVPSYTGARMVYYGKKGAFRAGTTSGGQWDDANVGLYSVAFGEDSLASGHGSVGWGSSWATAIHSTSFGSGTRAYGEASLAIGKEAVAGDPNAAGSKGYYAVAVGMGDSTAANDNEKPRVEGDGSFGIFMGDQKNVNVSANSVMALLGGRLVIDPDATSAANTNVSTGAQQLELDVQGDIGAVNYCDEAGNNCFTAATAAAGGSSALHAITAATNTNTIASGDHAQIWNWATTTAGKDAFTFGETTASTATGESSILKAATLAASTATPLMVTNLGAANSFRVNDETGDNDSSPFVIDAAGRVAIGATGASIGKLHIVDDIASNSFFPLYVSDTGANGNNLARFDRASRIALTIEEGGSATFLRAGNGNALNLSANDGYHQFVIDTAGNIGVSTNAPSYLLSLSGEAARTIGMEREQTADTAGNNLTLLAGGATTGATNKNGGDTVISSGTATGNGASSVIFKAVTGSQGTGTTDRAPAEVARFIGEDFVVGSPQLDDDGNAAHRSRVFFDKSKAAFRAGLASFQWDSGVVGDYSVALGYSNIANGTYSLALGSSTTASGANSSAFGTLVTASGTRAAGLGLHNGASVATVSGTNSFGIFMGDQSSVDVTASNVMALAGGSMIINPDTTSAADVTPDTALQVVGSIMMGDGGETCASGNFAGAIRYNGGAVQFCNGTAWANIAGAGGAALHQITAATNTNTIASGDHAQIWNWATTTAGKDAFTFGETTASTASGESSILKAATLAASTATPFMVTNLGAANSFRVNDETGDNDATAFVIDTAGNTGIGNSSPAYKLDMVSSSAATSGFGLYGANLQQNLWPGGNSSGHFFGARILTTTGSTVDYTGTVQGSESEVFHNGTGTVTSATGAYNWVQNKTTGTITNAYGTYSRVDNEDAGGAVTNAYGLYSTITKIAGTVTNSYGLYLGPQTGTNKWGVYQSAADNNYFAGNVGIATSAPSYLLSLGGDAARTIGMERHTTADTAGNNLTLLAGGATTGATNKNGGDLILNSGIATGTGDSKIKFNAYHDAALEQLAMFDGTYGSAAVGAAATADGIYSNAFGFNTISRGAFNTTLSTYGAYAEGSHAMAIGGAVGSTGDHTIAMGYEANVTSAATYSMALGLGVPTATKPQVSGDNSFGIFMSDQDSVNVSANNVMALAGGSMIINPDTTSAADVTPDTALQVVGSIMMGDGGETCSGGNFEGSIRYNTTDNDVEFCNGTTWANIAGSGGTTLNGITAATAPQGGIANGANTIVWNWDALTNGAAMKFATNGTAAGNGQKMLELRLEGANVSNTVTSYGVHATNLHTGTASTNVGLYASASGATNNYAAIFENGRVGIGTTTPPYLVSISDDQGATAGEKIQFSVGRAVGNYYGFVAGYIADGAADSGAFIRGNNNAPLHLGATGVNTAMTIVHTTGNVGLAATTPSYLLSLGGNAARTIGMERHTTADTAGNDLTILAGGATTGATNKDGGGLILSGGIATGTGDSNIQLRGYQNGSVMPIVTFLGDSLTADFAGNVRVPASGYYNFGATFGTGGYGIRDNAGTIECKNSGGAWAACAGGGSSTLGTSTSATSPQRSGEAGTGFWTSGTGSVSVSANSIETMRWNTTASGVNYFTVAPGATGVSPIISNSGTDTNGAGLGMRFIAKNATANGVGGPLTFTGGAGNGAWAGGAVAITAGQGGATGGGGALSLTAGAGGGTSGAGGAVAIAGGASTSGAGGGVSVTGANGLGAHSVGGAIDITAGNSVGNGVGAAVTISAGGANSATGGAVTIQSGAASVSGDGGDISVTAANAIGVNKTGGDITLAAGTSTSNFAGGAIALTSGQGGPTGAGGALSLVGGLAGSTSGAGGAVNITGGVGKTATAGSVVITGGDTITNGTAGGVSLLGGTTTNGAGGPITITASNGASGTNVGGNVAITAGTSSTSATGGTTTISGGTGGSTNGVGGATTINGGSGGASGNGGALNLNGGGVASGSANGGAVNITGGTAGATSGVGGGVTIAGSPGIGGTSAGGAISITAGTSAGGGTGPAASLTGGAGGSSGTGGVVTITGGAGGSTSGAGGTATVQGGAPANSGNGGSVILLGRNALAAGTGGNITATAGTSLGTNAGGGLTFAAGVGGVGGGNGGAASFTAGAANGNATGGAVTIGGGAGGATAGTGGAATLQGGAAAAGNSMGGAANVIAGAGLGNQAGGAAALTAGAGGANGAGGAINITSGAGGGTTGNSGAVNITGANATGTAAVGGAIALTGGTGANGSGGGITLLGGAGTTHSGAVGGAVSITAGASNNNNAGGAATLAAGTGGGVGGAGGAVNLTAGNGGGGVANGGTVTITSGTKTSSGVDGSIIAKIAATTYMTIQPPSTTSSSVVFAGTSAITVPSGTDAQRPSTPVGGMLRYNTTASTDKLEYYDAEGTAWVQLSAAGGSSTLGTSTSATSPQRSGEAGTGFWTSGTGSVSVSANSIETMRWNTTASGVNYVALASGATGASPTFTNLGTDTNGAGLGFNFTARNASALGAGGPITLTAGTGHTSAAGGAISINGGTGGSTTGVGGAVSVTAGTAVGSGNAAGGALSLGSGVGTGNGAGGTTTLSTGAGGGNGAGGAMTISTGAGSNAAGGAITISTGAALTGSNPGGAIAVTTGAGNGSGAGGALTMTAGAGGSSGGAGGALSLTSGAGGATSGNSGAISITGANAPSGSGGAATLRAGDSGNAAGADATVQGGNTTSGSSQTGGAAKLLGGNGGASGGTGGPIQLTAGAGGTSSGAGGAVTIAAGSATANTSAGGSVTVTAGNGTSGGGAGAGGNISMTAGSPGATGVTGTITLTGGAGASGNTAGGASSLIGGAGSGTQAGGASVLTGGAGGATGAGGAITITGGAGGATSGAGGALTIGSGAVTAGTNAAGATTTIKSGGATGNGASSIVFQTVVANQGSGATQRAPATSMTLESNALTIPTGATTAEPGQSGMQAAANGMIRYDTTTNKFRGYQNSAWVDLIGAGGSTTLNSITAATANNTPIDSGAYTIGWNWNSLSTQTALTLGSTSMTTGTLLKVENTNTASSTGASMIVTNATNGNGYGIFSRYSGTGSGYGIWGEANGTANTGYGVYGYNSTTGNGSGVFGAMGGTNNVGSAGWFSNWGGSNTVNYGVGGVTSTTGAGYGVFGQIAGAGNTGYGVYGTNASPTGYGVYSAGALAVVPAGMTIANGASAEFSSGIFTAPTITLGGATQITAQMDSFIFNAPTITRGGATTVDNAANVTVNGAPVEAGSVVLTNTYGLKINSASVSTATNSYGLYVDAMTGATNNYAAVFNTGRVGVGTAAPSSQMHLYQASGYNTLTIENDGNTSSDGPSIMLDRGHIAAWNGIDFKSAGSTLWGLGQMAGDDNLSVWYGGSTRRFTINASTGNVGIGMASDAPSYLLSLGGDAAQTIGMERHTTADTAGNNLTLLAGGATTGATNKAGGNLILSGGIATGAGDSDVLLKAYQNGAQITVATISGSSASLSVSSDVNYTGILTDTSDIRLKKDLTPLDAKDIISRLSQVDTYSFHMINDPQQRLELGVVAQQLEKIFPELVMTAKDEMGTKSVNYIGFIAPLIEASKSLKSENDALKEEIAALKADQEEMKSAFSGLVNDVKGLKTQTGYGIKKAGFDYSTLAFMLMILGASSAFFFAGISMQKSAKRKR